MKPLIHEIKYIDPLQIYNCFCSDSWSMFLDSADALAQSGGTNRYSFIGIDPFLKITCKNKRITCGNDTQACEDPFRFLQQQMENFHLETDKSLPPLQGGAIGYLSYDLGGYLEKIASQAVDDMQFYDLAMGLYDLIFSFDHYEKKAWIISSGFPELNMHAQEKRAKKRLDYALQRIEKIGEYKEIHNDLLSPQQIITNFSAEQYKKSVKKMQDYIREGDIFEVNLTQRFSAALTKNTSAFDIYRQLRLNNPAPFSAYLNLDNTVIASASPERFLRLKDNVVETRPIKGTRKRSVDLREDAVLKNDLLTSAKDHAENVMVVDLMRNDLSRVCVAKSIRVPQLCGLESFATVHHLVSVIQGRLKEGANAIDLLKATFPGGSITGAPKIRAMEIIAETEPTCRGPYCGSIGYLGFDGCLDTSIVIRTFAIKDNIITYQTGGAVTIDSDDTTEYEEMLNKAYALNKVLLGEVANDFVNR